MKRYSIPLMLATAITVTAFGAAVWGGVALADQAAACRSVR